MKKNTAFANLLSCFTISFCRHSRKPWSKFINADNQHLVSPEVHLMPVPIWHSELTISLYCNFTILLYVF